MSFGGSKRAPAVAPAPVPPPPVVEDAQVKAEDASAELRRRRGVASTVLTGSQGDTSNIKTAAKALLGA